MMQLFSSVKRRMSSREGHHTLNDSSSSNSGAASQQSREPSRTNPVPPTHTSPPISSTTAVQPPPSRSMDDGEPPPVDSKRAAKPWSPVQQESNSTSNISPAVTNLPVVATSGVPVVQPAAMPRPKGSSGRSPGDLGPIKSTDTPKPAAETPSRSSETHTPPPGLLVSKQSASVFSRLPLLKEIPNTELPDLLRRKLAACRDVIFDFKGSNADLWGPEKEAKRVALTEILDFINNTDRRPIALESVFEELIEMVSANTFRPLPPPNTSLSTLAPNDAEELEPILEPSWPHLQIIYEILLRFVMSNETNAKITKKFIDHNFVLRLLELFGSEDPRERDYLKTIMHRVYGKVMALRSFIRKAIQNVFFRYIHENVPHLGISELLEILGSIINGFAQPLKEEHKLFLKRSMIPLHKSRNLVAYHQQLTYCMTQYVEKDNKLVEQIVNGLLRYWPITNTPKEVLFLNEVEEILELTPPAEFQKIMEPLFKRMALCIQSPHFQIAERVLFLWNNQRIARLINQNKNQLFPILIGALYKNTKDHWNVTVHGLTFNVCKLLAEADPHLFDHCNDENLEQEERKQQDRETRRRAWEELRERGSHRAEHHEATAG